MIWLQTGLEQARVAVMLLTRLPAGTLRGTVPPMGQTLWAWPVVGALLGLGAAGLLWSLGVLGLPHLVAGGLALMALALATGGLHEDGLGDVADGFGGGQDRARKLEIMRDSRLGSYGALALIFAVALRLVAMDELPGLDDLAWGLVLAACVSRAMMVVPLGLLPAAREDGLGASVTASRPQAAVALGLGLALAVVLFGMVGLVSFVCAGAVALAMTWIAQRQIGGQTGDVCGATQVLSEIAVWVVLAAALG